MDSQLTDARKFIRTKIGIFITILLVLGIFFRFANLDQKIYWLDETHTSLRIFGYTEHEFIKDIFAGKVVNSEDLLKYQRPSPQKNWNDTFKIVSGNTEHAPLYYLMLRVWASFFGSSVAALRSFSAFISLFVFPCAYWLCQELFASSLVGWIAIALLAVSPFQVLYAQETRPYSLLTVAILLASAALLRAIRVQTKASWIVYAITVAFGLYTHWFFAVIAFSHGVYIAITERFRPTRTVIVYLLASLAGIFVFFPWIINTIAAPPPLKGQMGWVFQKVSLATLIKSWGLSISRAFFDVDRGWCLPLGNTNCRYWFSYEESFIYFLIIPLIFLVVYSLYFLYRHTPEQVWLFVVTLIVVMALALIIPDLLTGGQRSTVTRYLIPCLLGFQLAVAYLLANKMTVGLSFARKQNLWQIIFVVLLSLGVFSCIFTVSTNSWWSKGGNYHVTPIATIINKAEHPLLLYSVPSDVLWGKGGAVGRVLPLCRLLNSQVGILFVIQPNIPKKLPEGFSDVFLYRPHKELTEWLKTGQHYQLKPIDDAADKNTRLWKLYR